MVVEDLNCKDRRQTPDTLLSNDDFFHALLSVPQVDPFLINRMHFSYTLHDYESHLISNAFTWKDVPLESVECKNQAEAF